MELAVIAHLRCDLPDKFGVPRQSGLVDELPATIVFTPAYRDAAALRGLEGYTHIWLLWCFSLAEREGWSPTVRPPRLGGNRRMGVFATRSPYRPNPIGLSCVRLRGMAQTEEGTVLHVSGADLVDGTPIYDIKPYLPYADCHPEATGGFAPLPGERDVEVQFPEGLEQLVPEEKRSALRALLAQDPRPGYQHDPERVYGIFYADLNVRFTVADGTLTVCEVTKAPRR